MKAIGFLACACMCVAGCQSRATSTPINASGINDDATNTYLFREEVEPNFTEPKLAVGEKKVADHPIVIVDADIAYSNSIRNIDRSFVYEANVLASCLHTKINDPCIATQKELCSVDELIDTHGNIHKKPYCSSSWNMKLK